MTKKNDGGSGTGGDGSASTAEQNGIKASGYRASILSRIGKNIG